MLPNIQYIITMSKQGFKTYCNIFNYVEATDPQLASLLKGTCGTAALAPRGRNGVTFLMPDAALTKKIEEKAWSNNPDESGQAYDLLSACVLTDIFESVADFKSKPVINSLYPPQELKVEKIDGGKKEVHFSNGAVAKLDTRFIQMQRGNKSSKKLAVWTLSGALLPTDGPAAPEVKAQKKGSYQPVANQLEGLRYKIMLYVEQAYAFSCIQSKSAITSNDGYPYQRAVGSLLSYLRNNDLETYRKVLPVIMFDNFDFYILFEPHSTDIRLVPDQVLDAWYNANKNALMDISAYRQFRKVIEADIANSTNESILLNKNNSQGCAVFHNKTKLMEAIGRERRRATDAITSNVRRAIDTIGDSYTILEQQNKIGSVDNVYPEALHEYYKSRPGTKMLHDDIRYISFLRFQRLESMGDTFDLAGFNDLVNFIGDSLYANIDTQRVTTRGILNATRLKYAIAPTMERDEVLCFVNSTLFMCMPLTKGDIETLGRNAIYKPKPGKILLFNVHANIYDSFNRFSEERLKQTTDSIQWWSPEERSALLNELKKYEA